VTGIEAPASGGTLERFSARWRTLALSIPLDAPVATATTRFMRRR
jgi:hypothetical protein